MPKTVEKSTARTGVVKVTLSGAEKAILQRAADTAGIPLSIYVRAAALGKAQAK